MPLIMQVLVNYVVRVMTFLEAGAEANNKGPIHTLPLPFFLFGRIMDLTLQLPSKVNFFIFLISF